MKKFNYRNNTAVVFILLLYLVIAYGWLMNMIKVIDGYTIITPEFIIRIVGVLFMPLGVIMGYV